MAEKNMNAKISVEFEETANRQQLSSGDNLPTLFGKIKKIISDLSTSAFSGSYNDLSDTPTTATKDTDGLMSAADKTKLDGADNTYALKSKYGDTTINVGRKAGTAGGIRSTAEGWNTTASGDYSHAGGLYTKALHKYEVAYGRYNESNNNTLFSIGDGTADDVRHNAFEITATGGKLHDKDIATTDLIPTSLPANGGNADYATNAGNANTVDGLHADDFVNATDKGQIQIPNNVDVPAWIHANGKRFQRYMTNAGNIGLTNVPDNSTDYVWYWYDGLNLLARDNSSGKYYIGDTINGIFSGWKDVYTSGYKPYISGSATVAANNTTCTSNHGFTPSAVIWWDGNDSGVATWFNETQFAIKITSSVDRTINYLIFK